MIRSRFGGTSMSEQLSQRIAEVLRGHPESVAQGEPLNKCAYCLHDGDYATHVAEAVAAALPETIREYTPAYQAENGAVIPLGRSTTVLAEFAAKDAAAMRSPEDETEVFVAYRDRPKWTRAPWVEVQP